MYSCFILVNWLSEACKGSGMFKNKPLLVSRVYCCISLTILLVLILLYRLKENVQQTTSVWQDHGWNTEDIWITSPTTCWSGKYEKNVFRFLFFVSLFLVFSISEITVWYQDCLVYLVRLFNACSRMVVILLIVLGVF